MTTCVHCGATNADDAAVCPVCGRSQTLRSSSSSPWEDESKFAAQGNDKTSNIPSAIAANAGTRIAGRYDVISILGRGGTGRVYRAHDLELGEDIALKVLQGGVDATEIDRLRREALTARRISHPNVIRLHDFGVANGEGYLSMELLAGGTLSEKLNAPIPYEEALRIAQGITEGLAAAHREGIVHRDIKPQNVLFDTRGLPKLSDFGLARAVDASNTATKGFAGTPLYMSPEMADGREITARSDVYSLGVLLFELFTSQLPFQAETLLRLVLMHTQDAPPSPRTVRPDLPVELERVILRCLEKDPARRYVDANEVGADLAAIARGEEPSASMPRPPSLAAAAPIRPPRQIGFAFGLLGIAILGSATGIALAWSVGLFNRAPVATTATATPVAIASPVEMPSAATSPLAIESPVKTATPVATRVAVATRPGRLNVYAKPWAEVWVDGKLARSQSPLKDFPLPPGKHTIRAVNPANTLEKQVTVVSGRDVSVHVDMNTGAVSVD